MAQIKRSILNWWASQKAYPGVEWENITDAMQQDKRIDPTIRNWITTQKNKGVTGQYLFNIMQKRGSPNVEEDIPFGAPSGADVNEIPARIGAQTEMTELSKGLGKEAVKTGATMAGAAALSTAAPTLAPAFVAAHPLGAQIIRQAISSIGAGLGAGVGEKMVNPEKPITQITKEQISNLPYTFVPGAVGTNIAGEIKDPALQLLARMAIQPTVAGGMTAAKGGTVEDVVTSAGAEALGTPFNVQRPAPEMTPKALARSEWIKTMGEDVSPALLDEVRRIIELGKDPFANPMVARAILAFDEASKRMAGKVTGTGGTPTVNPNEMQKIGRDLSRFGQVAYTEKVMQPEFAAQKTADLRPNPQAITQTVQTLNALAKLKGDPKTLQPEIDSLIENLVQAKDLGLKGAPAENVGKFVTDRLESALGNLQDSGTKYYKTTTEPVIKQWGTTPVTDTGILDAARLGKDQIQIARELGAADGRLTGFMDKLERLVKPKVANPLTPTVLEYPNVKDLYEIIPALNRTWWKARNEPRTQAFLDNLRGKVYDSLDLMAQQTQDPKVKQALLDANAYYKNIKTQMDNLETAIPSESRMSILKGREGEKYMKASVKPSSPEAMAMDQLGILPAVQQAERGRAAQGIVDKGTVGGQAPQVDYDSMIAGIKNDPAFPPAQKQQAIEQVQRWKMQQEELSGAAKSLTDQSFKLPDLTSSDVSLATKFNNMKARRDQIANTPGVKPEAIQALDDSILQQVMDFSRESVSTKLGNTQVFSPAKFEAVLKTHPNLANMLDKVKVDKLKNLPARTGAETDYLNNLSTIIDLFDNLGAPTEVTKKMFGQTVRYTPDVLQDIDKLIVKSGFPNPAAMQKKVRTTILDGVVQMNRHGEFDVGKTISLYEGLTPEFKKELFQGDVKAMANADMYFGEVLPQLNKLLGYFNPEKPTAAGIISSARGKLSATSWFEVLGKRLIPAAVMSGSAGGVAGGAVGLGTMGVLAPYLITKDYFDARNLLNPKSGLSVTLPDLLSAVLKATGQSEIDRKREEQKRGKK